MNRLAIKAVDTLARRANFLKGRAAIREFDGKPASFDDGEIVALDWAVSVIKKADAAGILERLAALPDVQGEHIRSRLMAVSRTPATPLPGNG